MTVSLGFPTNSTDASCNQIRRGWHFLTTGQCTGSASCAQHNNPTAASRNSEIQFSSHKLRTSRPEQVARSLEELNSSHFYRALLCIRGTSHWSVSVCVCPSVRLSQVRVLLKRLNVGSHKQHHTIAQGL